MIVAYTVFRSLTPAEKKIHKLFKNTRWTGQVPIIRTRAEWDEFVQFHETSIKVMLELDKKYD